ncbi:MAG: AI-2E family transporter [Thermoplasmatales archaeon]
MLSTFWRSIVWASIITVTIWPIHSVLKSRLRSSLISAVTITFFFLFASLSALIPVMVKIYIEASDFLQRISVEQFQDIIASIPSKLKILGTEIEIPVNQIRDFLVNLSSAVLPFVAQLLSSAASSLAQIAITAIIVFFFLKDGDSITQFINSFFINSFFVRYFNFSIADVLGQTASIVRHVVIACFVTAFVQGVISGLGWYIFGVPYPLVLGFFVFILGFTPVGPALLYIPAGVTMCFINLFSGIGVLLWHFLLVSMVDNLLRPILLSRTMNVNEWLLMFTTFGAIYYFGFLGLFAAPLMLVFTAQLLEPSESCNSTAEDRV